MGTAWDMLNSRLIPEPSTCLNKGLCEPWELEVVEREQTWLLNPEYSVMLQEAEIILDILESQCEF